MTQPSYLVQSHTITFQELDCQKAWYYVHSLKCLNSPSPVPVVCAS